MMTDKAQIKIKPENVGKFTEWCRRKGHAGVTNNCINEGLGSKLAKVRKQAQFAKNVKSWGK